MTENENKKLNIAVIGGGRSVGRTLKAQLDLYAELESYRSIGTVEDIEKGIKQSEEEFEMLMEYKAIGTVEEFKALKECFGYSTQKSRDKAIYNKAVDDFANFIHKKAKENNGLRLSSETRSWTHASIFDYVNEFREEQLKGGTK